MEISTACSDLNWRCLMLADVYPQLKLSLSLEDVTLKALQVPPLHHFSFSRHFLLFLEVLELIREDIYWDNDLPQENINIGNFKLKYSHDIKRFTLCFLVSSGRLWSLTCCTEDWSAVFVQPDDSPFLPSLSWRPKRAKNVKYFS